VVIVAPPLYLTDIIPSHQQHTPFSLFFSSSPHYHYYYYYNNYYYYYLFLLLLPLLLLQLVSGWSDSTEMEE